MPRPLRHGPGQGLRDVCVIQDDTYRRQRNPPVTGEIRPPAENIHGISAMTRHSTVLPEWVMRIIENPYDQWVEIEPGSAEVRTVSYWQGAAFCTMD